MDEDLMFETGTKILEDRLKEADFDNIFVLFEQVCNSDDILTFTLKGYSESFQFVFDEYSYAIVFVLFDHQLLRAAGKSNTAFCPLLKKR